MIWHALVALAMVLSFVYPSATPTWAAGGCDGRIVAIGIDQAQAARITWPRWSSDDFKIVTAVAIQVGSGEEIQLHNYTTPETHFKNGQLRREWYLNSSGYYCLPNHSTALFTVLALEDDDIAMPRMDRILLAAASGLGAVVSGQPELADLALAKAKDAVGDVVAAFHDNGDDILGAFLVTVTNQDGTLAFTWQPLEETVMHRYDKPNSPLFALINDDSGSTFEMTGDSSHYILNASVWSPDTWPE